MGVFITKGAPGVSVVGSADAISGLVAQAVAVATKCELGKVYTLYQPEDAENIGIDAAYDSTNKLVVYRHITEFYRMRGKGVKLYLMLAPQNLAFTALVEDAGNLYAKKMIIEAKGEIRQLAFAFNPESAYVPSYVDGLDNEIFLSIAKAQALHVWTYETFRPCSILLEGRDVNDIAALPDLRAIDNLSATKVSICIGQDYAYAETLDAENQKFADVGTLLGTVAKCDVAQNIGDHTNMNITDAVKSAFLACGISSHVTIESLESQWATIGGKGFIFPIYETGYAGHYWNDDHVCAPVVIDAEGVMNEHSILLGRTSDKAVRLLRAALLPKVKTKQPVDTATGKLPIGVIKYFESLGDDEFERMKTKEEISGGKTFVDPNSDLITPPKTLNVSFTIVPYGTIGEIRGVLNIKNQI